jgi:hypothetical protein
VQITKRMHYKQFLSALAACADARGVDAAALQDRIAACDGPILHGTQADAVRFHDHRVLPVERKAPPEEQKGKGRPSWQEK